MNIKKAARFRKNLKSNYIKVLKQAKKRIVRHPIRDRLKENPLAEDLPLTLHRF